MSKEKYVAAPPFDIFLTQTEGVLWLESAETLEGAKARIQELAARSPGEYLLLNQVTGNKLTIKPSATYGAPDLNGLRFSI
jgi:hypothetical protein